MTVQSVGLDFSPVYKVQELNRKKMGTDCLAMTGIFGLSPWVMGEGYIAKNPKTAIAITGISVLASILGFYQSNKISKEIEEIKKLPVKLDVQA